MSRFRFAYGVSAAAHAALFWALASAEEALRVEFAVRSGQSSLAVSQVSRARAATEPIDSKLLIDSPAVVDMSPPEFPKESSASSPSAAALDDRYVVRPPVEERVRRRMERSVEVAKLPDAPPMPFVRPETTPKSEGRPLDRLWAPIPSPEAPQAVVRLAERGRLPTPTVAEVLELGDSEATSVAANVPQGAKVDRLPRPLPANREPEYPEDLRRRQIEGRVLLSVIIAVDGSVSAVRVAESSGQPALDQSAVSAIRGWRFEPARRGNLAVEFEVRLPIRFSIRR